MQWSRRETNWIGGTNEDGNVEERTDTGSWIIEDEPLHTSDHRIKKSISGSILKVSKLQEAWRLLRKIVLLEIQENVKDIYTHTKKNPMHSK